MRIKSLTIVTTQGVSIYNVETDKIGSISSIQKEPVYFNGNPEEHYIGRGSTGNELLRVHPSVPMVIDFEY